jgi:hypothetical protein
MLSEAKHLGCAQKSFFTPLRFVQNDKVLVPW